MQRWHRLKVWTLLALALAIALATRGVGAADPAPETTLADRPPLIMPGDPPDLVFFHTGEVLGYLTPCGCSKNPAGGLARRAWVIDEVGQRYPGAPRVLVDSGNFSDNPTPEGDTKTRALLEGMERIGYRAVNVGERDIRLGYDEFRRLTEGRSLHFVSSNIVRQDNQEPVFEPHVVLEVSSPDGQHKRRVGVVGAVRFNPVFLKAGPTGTSMVIVPPLERVKKEVDALRAKDVDAIVLLAALHKADAMRLAEQVEGIDFVFGSYGGMHTPVAEPAGGASVFYSGNRGARLVEVRAFLGDERHQTSRVHFLNREYPFEPSMVEFVSGFVTDDPEAEGDAEAAELPEAGARGSAERGGAAPAP